MKCLLCGSDYLLTVTTELRNGPGDVLRCGACDLEMLNGAPAVDYAQAYRDGHGPVLGQRNTPVELFTAYRPHQEHRVALLKPLFTKTTRVLEIGCSAGQFLDTVKPHVKEAVGIEVDPGAAAYAQERTGCSVYAKLSELPKGTFGLLCYFQVVEHLTNPLEEIRAALPYLAPEGVLCIEVPSLRDPLLTVYQNAAYRTFYYHEAHRFYFSPKSLRLLIEQLGFTGDVYGVQDYTFLNHLHWAFTGKPQASCEEGLVAKWPAHPPQLPEVLDDFAVAVDQRYKTYLAQIGCTENITFVGRRP